MVHNSSIDLNGHWPHNTYFTTTQRCTIFKRKLYSNTAKLMLFFSDVKQYIPVKLCKTAGSIHLFQIYGQLTSNQTTLERNFLWDVIKIE